MFDAISLKIVSLRELSQSDAGSRQIHASGLILAQVMVYCLTAPSHYLNRYWLTPVRSSDDHLTVISHEIPQPLINEFSWKITYLNFHSNLPGFNVLRGGVDSDIATTSYLCGTSSGEFQNLLEVSKMAQSYPAISGRPRLTRPPGRAPLIKGNSFKEEAGISFCELQVHRWICKQRDDSNVNNTYSYLTGDYLLKSFTWNCYD